MSKKIQIVTISAHRYVASRVVESTMAVVKFKKRGRRSTSTSEAETTTEAEKEEEEEMESEDVTEEMEEDLGEIWSGTLFHSAVALPCGCSSCSKFVVSFIP